MAAPCTAQLQDLINSCLPAELCPPGEDPVGVCSCTCPQPHSKPQAQQVPCEHVRVGWGWGWGRLQVPKVSRGMARCALAERVPVETLPCEPGFPSAVPGLGQLRPWGRPPWAWDPRALPGWSSGSQLEGGPSSTQGTSQCDACGDFTVYTAPEGPPDQTAKAHSSQMQQAQ